MTAGFCHYHDKPSPHLVMDAATWERLKADSAKVSTDPIGGRPSFVGTPVYVGSCPWECES